MQLRTSNCSICLHPRLVRTTIHCFSLQNFCGTDLKCTITHEHKKEEMQQHLYRITRPKKKYSQHKFGDLITSSLLTLPGTRITWQVKGIVAERVTRRRGEQWPTCLIVCSLHSTGMMPWIVHTQAKYLVISVLYNPAHCFNLPVLEKVVDFYSGKYGKPREATLLMKVCRIHAVFQLRSLLLSVDSSFTHKAS